MKPSLQKKRQKVLWLITIVCLGLGLLWAAPGWGESGLSLTLYTLEESHKFPAKQPIPIIGVLKNEKKWPLNMDLGFGFTPQVAPPKAEQTGHAKVHGL